MTEYHAGPTLGEKDGYAVIDCRDCGFAHLWPLPSKEELAELYSEKYYAEEKPNYLKHQEEDSDWWISTYNDRLTRIEDLLSDDRRSALDVGSGPGWFLQVAERRGWRAVGLEPALAPHEYCRGKGLDVIRGKYPADAPARKFDLIHFGQTLEHLWHPAEIVDFAYGHLSPGGILSVTVPNDFSPLQTALEANGWPQYWVAPPYHVSYFSPESLALLVAEAGFEVVAVDGSFPMELFLLLGADYVGHPKIGRACHRARMLMEKVLDNGYSALKRRIYKALIEIGVGREVTVTARKPCDAQIFSPAVTTFANESSSAWEELR